MPLDLDKIDQPDGRLVQAGLKQLGFYDGTMLGIPGPKTKGAYERYRGTPEAGPVEVPVIPAAPGGLPKHPKAVRAEFEFPGVISSGAKKLKARRIQEWLTIHGFKTGIDNDFGSATERALKSFQGARGIEATGKVGRETWDALVAPMIRAFSDVEKGATVGDTVLQVANQHLAEHPIELGGANNGPWVRAYMTGNQGRAFPWCAGFVTFVLKQAAAIHGVAMPIKGSVSCDVLAAQAKQKDRFVSGKSINSDNAKFSDASLGTCCVFLVFKIVTKNGKKVKDWTHTGFAFDYESNGTFATIEGNTNDEGSREGFEVCNRVRSRTKKDFIRII